MSSSIVIHLTLALLPYSSYNKTRFFMYISYDALNGAKTFIWVGEKLWVHFRLDFGFLSNTSFSLALSQWYISKRLAYSIHSDWFSVLACNIITSNSHTIVHSHWLCTFPIYASTYHSLRFNLYPMGIFSCSLRLYNFPDPDLSFEFLSN